MYRNSEIEETGMAASVLGHPLHADFGELGTVSVQFI